MTFPKFHVWKVESIPRRCLLHRLYAAFLCHKMNYRRAPKVNQEFFLLRVKWDHTDDGRLPVTYSKALRVCLLSAISHRYQRRALRLTWHISSLYGNEKTNNDLEYHFFRLPIFRKSIISLGFPSISQILSCKISWVILSLWGRWQRHCCSYNPPPCSKLLRTKLYISLFQELENCDHISADGDSRYTIKSKCMQSSYKAKVTGRPQIFGFYFNRIPPQQSPLHTYRHFVFSHLST